MSASIRPMVDSREGFSVNETEVYEAMADMGKGYPCHYCGKLCDEDFCSQNCEDAQMYDDECDREHEENDGQPSEYTEWQDLHGGDDNPADWVYDGYDRDFGMDG